MALKTNSKAVKEALKKYLLESAKDAIIDYDPTVDPETLTNESSADFIAKTFINEMLGTKPDHQKNSIRYYKHSLYNAFESWCQGLPSALNCNYYLYYLNNPVELLGDILKATPAEKAKYNDDEAAKILTQLLYNTLHANIIKNISASVLYSNY